jgi:N-glycosidase YbiA
MRGPSTKPALVEVWRRIIVGDGKACALFEGGTCVIFAGAREGVAEAAVSLLREWGPVHAGSPAGDFSVITLESAPGWVVTCHHPDVLTYVAPEQVESAPSELQVGLLGRLQRDQDAQCLHVIYVEGDSTAEPVRFYSKTADYHELSNFAPFGFEEAGAFWPTVEHYFQAQKFSGPENAAYREKIRTAKNPRDAKTLGRTRKIPIRGDWDRARDEVMLHAIRRKFEAANLREQLLSTGLRPLIEASPTDYYWGSGRTGSGRNRLGQLLMQVRAELRSASVERPRD